MKNIKCIYESYIPKIIRNNNGIKYNLSEDNIFGNLNYSMNKNLLKGKTVEFDSFSLRRKKIISNDLNEFKPSKLIPIMRYKPSQ